MTHKIRLSDLKENSRNRPLIYYTEATSLGRIEGDVLILEDEAYNALRKKYSLKKAHQPIKPVPASEWPIWAKALKQFSKPEDKGIGDVVARAIGAEASADFKAFYKKVTGKDCGCTGRQARWNLMYPLKTDA